MAERVLRPHCFEASILEDAFNPIRAQPRTVSAAEFDSPAFW
jgi:hypothetical protein